MVENPSAFPLPTPYCPKRRVRAVHLGPGLEMAGEDAPVQADPEVTEDVSDSGLKGLVPAPRSSSEPLTSSGSTR